MKAEGDIKPLLKAINETSGRGSRVTHLLGDIRHGQIVLAGKVGEQEELREGDVPTVELTREVQDARALCEEDKVRKTIRIRLDCTS